MMQGARNAFAAFHCRQYWARTWAWIKGSVRFFFEAPRLLAPGFAWKLGSQAGDQQLPIRRLLPLGPPEPGR
jgi:hypothetical protein